MPIENLFQFVIEIMGWPTGRAVRCRPGSVAAWPTRRGLPGRQPLINYLLNHPLNISQSGWSGCRLSFSSLGRRQLLFQSRDLMISFRCT